MTISLASDNHIFLGVDVGGTSFEAAWHRGGCAQYQNRPDAIAAFVKRLCAEKAIMRIAVEPTGGYEKSLVKALRCAGLPVEMVHTSRFVAYRNLVGVKAKSDTSDARLLAAYAAAPDEVRGRKADYVEIPQDAVREQLAELAARRDQLKRMIHAETCRPPRQATTSASWPVSMTASSQQESHLRSRSSPSCAASSSTQTLFLDHASLGKVPKLFDNRHGRSRVCSAPLRAAPGMILLC